MHVRGLLSTIGKEMKERQVKVNARDDVNMVSLEVRLYRSI